MERTKNCEGKDNKLVNSHFLTEEEAARVKLQIKKDRERLDRQTGADKLRQDV